ncbi:hypothetical protein AAFN86_16035 [Roseomonas sp. CAU 1739]|uniref:AbiU2 domain-containing protein n=1 Tax=Roseomonas sp. CAU 1739 TaxID=3140364 RepID=UPI00325ACD4E
MAKGNGGEKEARAETAEQEQQRLGRLVTRMTEAMREASLMAAMLRVANSDTSLRAALHSSPQVPGFNAVYHAILGRLVLALTSLLDKASSNRASVPTAMDILARRDVRRRLTREAALWLNANFPHRAARNARACVRHRRRAESTWNAITSAPDWSDRLDRLRHLRDVRLTHALFDMPGKPGPLYGWLEDIHQQLRPIVVSLRFAVHGDGGAETDDEEEEENFVRESEAFWTALRVGTAAIRAKADQEDGTS